MKQRPGRPRLMTDRDCRALKKVVRETRQTSSELDSGQLETCDLE
jgi:hypothetical protein